MGQYYRACMLNEKKDKVLHFADSWTYGCGCKLMEHSYMKNKFVRAVVDFVRHNGGANLVWAGDYGDQRIPGEGDKMLNYYEASRQGSEIIIIPGESVDDMRYLVNHDKKEYVDLWNIPSVDGWEVHPLPLLCADGNGRGGGDYEGTGMKYVGSWAGDFITVETDFDPGEEYKEIKPNFIEFRALSMELQHIVKYLSGELIPDYYLKSMKESVKKIKEVLG